MRSHTIGILLELFEAPAVAWPSRHSTLKGQIFGSPLKA
jgi:hypothetical protein